MRISLEEFSTVTAAIHAAAASGAVAGGTSAVAHLVASPGVSPSRDRGWQNVLASLDRLGVTAFIVNANGTVHQQNASARNLLAGDESVHVASFRLRLSDRAGATLEAAVHRATKPPCRSSLFPVRAGKNEVYEVNVSPLQPAEDAGSALALVVIARPRPDASGSLGACAGLASPRPRRMVAALTLGETVEQIAVARGRVSTVRQVRSIEGDADDLVDLALTRAAHAVRTDAQGTRRYRGGHRPSC